LLYVVDGVLMIECQGMSPSKRWQPKKRRWSRTERRENREFLRRRFRNGEATDDEVIIREVFCSRTMARRFYLYS
jgi:hypothetical protein